MPRTKNDGRGRMGGRAKGTKNKPLQPVGEWVEEIINRNRARFEKDLEQMEPDSRCIVLAALMSARADEVLKNFCPQVPENWKPSLLGEMQKAWDEQAPKDWDENAVKWDENATDELKQGQGEQGAAWAEF